MKTIKEYTRWNKKGMLVRTWVIAFLVFSSIFGLLFLAAKDMANNYGVESIIQDDYQEKYDVFNKSSYQYRETYESIQEGTGLKLIFAEVTGIFSSFFDTIQITFGSVGIAQDITKDFVEDFGVPESIANIIFPLGIMIIMVFLIFAVISTLQQGNKL